MNTHTKEVIKLSTPLILGQIGVIILSFVDSIMVGHVSTIALAASTFVNGVFSFFGVFALGFSFGLMPVITDMFTQKDYQGTGRALFSGLCLNTLFTLAMMPLLFFIYVNIDLFHLPKEVAIMARPYYITQVVGYIFMMLFLSFKQYFDAIGRTEIGMATILISTFSNIILNYWLIFGGFSVAPMGLYGAGIATLISRIISLICIIGVFFYADSFRIARQSFVRLKVKVSELLRILKLSIPLSIQMGVESASFTIVMLFVPPIGVIALASNQIITTLTTLGYMIFYGVGSATTILVSKYRSSGDHIKSHESVQKSLKITLILSIILIIALLALRNIIVQFFTNDEKVIEMVAVVIIPLALYQIGDATQIIYNGALRGLQDVKFVAYSSIVIHLFMTTILATIASKLPFIQSETYKLTALWMVFPITLSTLALTLRWRYQHIRKKYFDRQKK